jgi:hypothetical protein
MPEKIQIFHYLCPDRVVYECERPADMADANQAALIAWAVKNAAKNGASLVVANLEGANLHGANLVGANLHGFQIPVLENIDVKILAAVETEGNSLNMREWHSCETTHCRAGWAIHLCGAAGYALEEKVGSSAAGALIYALSRPGKPIPSFTSSHTDAMADMRACAAEAA